MKRQLITTATTLAILLAGSAATLVPVPASAQNWSQTCYNLWYQRNAIYARNGYCFKTDRARNVFGPGCFPPYGRVSPGEQNQIDWIQNQERQMGCQ